MALRAPSILFLLILSGCTIAYIGRGVFHEVEEGETLWGICRVYGADFREVVEINGIRDPSKLRAGRRIFIPRATRVKRAVAARTDAGTENRRRGGDGGKPRRPKVEGAKKLLWPVRGTVVASFGSSPGMEGKGIEIRAPRGSPVAAAMDGLVVYSDDAMSGYGNIIIIKHGGGLYTVYAYNETNLVETGERVRRGEVIARVGRSAKTGDHRLHFEVRQG
ncbi:MAG TPA: LysM peptidoglycan-binding domain-containing protein, partial [Deltaproteobacteria bacterium]|nr:LysM peptidoglycan-binding domain-containing protein [Deltaproteobacteria bacterium]